MGPPWRVVDGGVALSVRLTPRGGRDAIEGVGAEPSGAPVLTARVAAPPAGGAANAALIRLVARAAGVAKGRVTLVAGATARVKRLRIAGDAEAIIARLSRL